MQLAPAILPSQHVQEPQKVGSGTTGATLAHDCARGHLQRGIEIRQSVSTVVMDLPGRHTRLQMQNGLHAVESRGSCYSDLRQN